MADVDHVLAGVIAAHDGAGLWQRPVAIEAVLSVDGFLFAAKRVPPLRRVRVMASTTAPRFTFFDYPNRCQRGEWFGEEEVSMLRTTGRFWLSASTLALRLEVCAGNCGGMSSIFCSSRVTQPGTT